MIIAENLGKQFQGFVAVDDVSFAVGRGELLALLGPNGAGKTTTVRMLSAILRPSQGRARVDGHDVVAEPTAVRRAIGLLTEQPGLYERMNGLEYLQFYGRLYGLPEEASRRRGVELFERFAMGGQEQRRLGDYSKGMRQKVGLIRAILHQPPVLLLDEPTSAMDPHSARLVRDAIREMRDGEQTVVLCTHNLTEAEQLADRIAIVSRGRIIAQGTPAELKRQLLGDPLYEVVLDRPVPPELPAVAALVELEQTDERRLRYRTLRPAEINPRVVRHLGEMGLGIVALSEITSSLEEVYLRVVGSAAAQENGSS